jgi:hypothetical protein
MVCRDHVDSVIMFIYPIDLLIVFAIRPHFVKTGLLISLLIRIWFNEDFCIV